MINNKAAAKLIASTISILGVLAVICVPTALVVTMVHQETAKSKSSIPKITSVGDISTLDKAKTELSRFGEVSSSFYPDGSWRVWMSGSRNKVRKTVPDAVWNGDEYLADRQCLQVYSLNNGEPPKLDQYAVLKVKEYGGDVDCPLMGISSYRIASLSNEEKARANDQFKNTSPRMDAIYSYNNGIRDAYSQRELLERIFDPGNAPLPVENRIPVVSSWKVDTRVLEGGKTVVTLKPPPPPVSTYVNWIGDNKDPVKPLLGWLVIVSPVEEISACVMSIEDATSCK